MLIFILVIVGLAAGSFVNALVWRVHEQAKKKKSDDLSILKGRSMCPRCKHELAAADLIPVLSWLWLRGKCRYCQKPISLQYPVVELAVALVFISSYFWWPGSLGDDGQRTLFTTWLWCSVGLSALLIYDVRWMLLPNRILYPVLSGAVVGHLLYLLKYADDKPHTLLLWALSVAVASGFFLLLYIYSKGKWIGFGDVRLGLITGTLLAQPWLAFGMIFLASVLGTVFALPALAAGRKDMASRIPYGPYLIFACYIMILFGEHLVHDYQKLLT